MRPRCVPWIHWGKWIDLATSIQISLAYAVIGSWWALIGFLRGPHKTQVSENHLWWRTLLHHAARQRWFLVTGFLLVSNNMSNSRPQSYTSFWLAGGWALFSGECLVLLQQLTHQSCLLILTAGMSLFQLLLGYIVPFLLVRSDFLLVSLQSIKQRARTLWPHVWPIIHFTITTSSN